MPVKLQISVIIVNFNVRHFLEQCLHSLRYALKNIPSEVFVVDNASTDGSVSYLKPLFPEVKWMVQTENEGFGKANNRALVKASGEYILFLNPDTLLPEDCLQRCLGFMKSTKDAGALGIKMVDGSGRFLPESKRAFPAPFTSLFKLLGLAALFPKSPVFARYSLGHLSEHQNQQVEVLAGAFMLLRKKVLDVTGGFDEQFFMYGEDIDLSYRVLQTHQPNGLGGWKNFYFAESSIIHFKGESTKRGSLNYVQMFYHAMAVFVKKHYGKGKANLFSSFIFIAIWLRALLSLLGSIFQDVVKLGATLFGSAMLLLRKMLVSMSILRSENGEPMQILVAGSLEDYEMVKLILCPQIKDFRQIGRLSVSDKAEPDALMTLHKWVLQPHVLPAKELIFCIGSTLSMQQVITLLKPNAGIHYRFYYTKSRSIVSSSHSKIAGESLGFLVA